jgi:hypothetical protein
MTQPPSKQTRHLSAEDEPSETARLMLPGPEKNEALKKAGILRKTADATSPVATIDILYRSYCSESRFTISFPSWTDGSDAVPAWRRGAKIVPEDVAVTADMPPFQFPPSLAGGRLTNSGSSLTTNASIKLNARLLLRHNLRSIALAVWRSSVILISRTPSLMPGSEAK